MSSSFHTTPEKELLQQVAEGDERAFSELFKIYRAKLYTHVFNLTHSKEAAEDTVHDVFLKIWVNRAELLSIDNFGGYLYRMAQNRTLNALRRQAKEILILAELRTRQPNTYTDQPTSLVVSKEVQASIRQAIGRLTPRQREVFLLSREGGLEHAAIARQLQISVFAVKKHMVDALKVLREELGNQYGSYAIALFVLYNLEIV